MRILPLDFVRRETRMDLDLRSRRSSAHMGRSHRILGFRRGRTSMRCRSFLAPGDFPRHRRVARMRFRYLDFRSLGICLMTRLVAVFGLRELVPWHNCIHFFFERLLETRDMGASVVNFCFFFQTAVEHENVYCVVTSVRGLRRRQTME